jgi:exosortase D (VPLPA-CTERM-specific)
MLMKTSDVNRVGSLHARTIYLGLIFCVLIAICFATFRDGIWELVRRWRDQEEYSHGFLIPFIAAWLLWTRRDALVSSIGRPSWFGAAAILLAAAMQVVGKLSSLFFLSHFGFIVALIGITLGIGGFSLLRVAFVPIVFLIFAIPMPYFIDAVLSWRLQIISSELGVAFIRLFQIPVFLEGNVIDLGQYKLQVVEACSGLRYLYPLMSLGFLAAYFFHAPIWQRIVVFLSAIPITILMNSLRIGVVGILVDNFGPQDADGFLHMFEGWIIFIACALLLVAEMHLLSRTTMGKGFYQVFYPPKIEPVRPAEISEPSKGWLPLLSCLVLMCATGLATYLVSSRHEIIPERRIFAGFPMSLGDWVGRSSPMDQATEQFLGMTDYINADYAKRDGRSVNLYIAYYATQRTGVSPHSPAVCLPGNGWQMTLFERAAYRNDQLGLSLPINRVIMSRGSNRELVYYWFEERGMRIANEYASKLYLLRDAIVKNRTDGALVRLITPIFPGESEEAAEQRLQQFIQTLMPNLAGFLPSEPGSKMQPAMKPAKAKNS